MNLFLDRARSSAKRHSTTKHGARASGVEQRVEGALVDEDQLRRQNSQELPSQA